MTTMITMDEINALTKMAEIRGALKQIEDALRTANYGLTKASHLGLLRIERPEIKILAGTGDHRAKLTSISDPRCFLIVDYVTSIGENEMILECHTKNDHFDVWASAWKVEEYE